MITSRRSTWLAIAVGALAAIAAFPFSPGAGGTAAQQRGIQDDGDLSEEIRGLREERVAVLRERVELVRQEFEAGQTTSETIIRAENDLIDAQLDLTRDRADRIALRERLVRNLKALEERIAAAVEVGATGGEATRTSYLVAKARRLDAEITLLQERGGVED